MKRTLSIVLALAMLFSCISMISVSAEETGEQTPLNSVAMMETYVPEDLEYVISNGEVMITGCNSNTVETLNIPAIIKGYPVTAIGDRAFADSNKCGSITEIIIPESVTEIGYDAFMGTAYYKNADNWENKLLYIDDCLVAAKTSLSGTLEIKEGTRLIACDVFYRQYNVTAVKLPSTLKYICEAAFYNCPELAEINLPEGLLGIGEEAFYLDQKLNVITVPDSVVEIGNNAFYYTGYYNNEANWTDGILFSGNHLLAINKELSGTFTVRDGIRTIGVKAFYDQYELDKVVLPSSLKSIGEKAFKNSSITEIHIPQNVEKIAIDAFNYCTYLEKVTVDANNENYFCEGNCLVETKTGNLIVGLAGAVIPESVTNIVYGAFSGQPITEITVPDSVKTIGESAFADCYILENVKLGSGIETISAGTFTYCIFLDKIEFPENLKNIADDAFSYCLSLEEVIIPDSVTTVGSNAFAGCASLKNVKLPSGLKEISNYTFFECTALNNVTIPETVESIGWGAFIRCESFTEINIPKNVEQISTAAFAECNGVNSITVDEDNENYYSDGNCLMEKSTKMLLFGSNNSGIPQDTKEINTYAFRGFKGLRSIRIPASVTKIGTYAFKGTSNLTSITVNAGNEKYYSSGNCLIEKNTNKLLLGCSSSVIPQGITRIEHSAFEDCKDLKSIHIPSSVTYIGERAFAGCTLTSVTVDAANTKYYAKNNCLIEKDSKTLVIGGSTSVIPSDVKSIDPYAFCGNEELTEITVPNGVTYLAYKVFADCKNLTTIVLPDTIEGIESYALENTDSLKNVCFMGNEDAWNDIWKNEWTNLSLINANIMFNFDKNKNGWQIEKNAWVFYENGIRLTNTWKQDSVGWCYLRADGTMATNEWILDSVGWCYVGSDGYCVTNCWMQDSVGWCYLDSEGRMATNTWILDSVGWCYVGSDGYCITNSWMADSVGWVYLDSEGRMKTNAWVMDSVGWCYVGADGYAVTNTWMADSIGWCYLDSEGRMVTNDFVYDSNGKCWLDENGYWDGKYL